MTELEQVRAMLTRAGVVFDEVRAEGCLDGGTLLDFRARSGPNNHGYTGTYAVLQFDADGVLECVHTGELWA